MGAAGDLRAHRAIGLTEKTMKKILPLFSALLLVIAVRNASAALADSDRISFDPAGAQFADNELSIDLFGFTASKDRNGNPERSWGPGVAANYFICRYFGVGGETYADAWNKPYLLNALGEIRYPLDKLLQAPVCPYAFGGVGRQWTYEAQWLGHIGFGAEFRFNAHTGMFVDWRHVFASNDYNVVRFGLR